MMQKTEPCSCAVAEDMIKLLLAGGKAGRGDIGVLQVCKGKQYCLVLSSWCFQCWYCERGNQQQFCGWFHQKSSPTTLEVIITAMSSLSLFASNWGWRTIFDTWPQVSSVHIKDWNTTHSMSILSISKSVISYHIKLTVYSMWLLVSGGLKPLASYSPTRTLTRLKYKHKPPYLSLDAIFY